MEIYGAWNEIDPDFEGNSRLGELKFDSSWTWQ